MEAGIIAQNGPEAYKWYHNYIYMDEFLKAVQGLFAYSKGAMNADETSTYYTQFLKGLRTNAITGAPLA